MAIRHYEGEIIIYESQKYPEGEAWKMVKKRVDAEKRKTSTLAQEDTPFLNVDSFRSVDKRAVMLFGTVLYFFLANMY